MCSSDLGNLVVVYQCRRMADTGKLDQLRLRTALRHLHGGVAGQQIRLRAAQQQRLGPLTSATSVVASNQELGGVNTRVSRSSGSNASLQPLRL